MIGVLLGGCNTPSVPLPPPLELTALSFTAPNPGLVEFRGKPSARHAGAIMFAFNRTRGNGVLQRTNADGSFATEPFGGKADETIELSYEKDGRRSDGVRCELRLDVPLDTTICH